jgi:hypothetical protein
MNFVQRGIFDSPPTDAATNELERRSVDFGNGNDWDADADGGGTDLGGGSDHRGRG